jgi:prepilin-type N-terminal cleavage/methylation domain-containing protein/prepilin-type processing-associated H-X9-DG protein
MYPARRSAFTLVEMLVVLVIIGILTALVVPSVQGVRHFAFRATCANNLRQFGVAYNHWLTGGKPLRAKGWTGRLLPLVENNRGIYLCPEGSKGAYATGDLDMKGYSDFTYPSWFLIPFDPTHPRCKLVEETDESITYIFEDWYDFDWDMYVKVTRLPSGGINMKTWFRKYTHLTHTIRDPEGKEIPGLIGIPYPQTRDVMLPGYSAVPTHYGMNNQVSNFLRGDQGKVLMLDAHSVMVDVAGFDARDCWPQTVAARHGTQVNVLYADGHVAPRDPLAIDPTDSGLNARLWTPTKGAVER